MINIIDIIKTLIQKTISVTNDKVSKKQLINFYKTKDITSKCIFTKGSNWTIKDKSIRLIGNTIITYLSVKATTATGAGAISNQTMATIKIPLYDIANTNPPILDFYQSSGNTSTAGGLAAVRTANSTIENGYLSYVVNITATHQAISNLNFTLTSLVRFDSGKIMDYLNNNI
jgi:hypothetical protein